MTGRKESADGGTDHGTVGDAVRVNFCLRLNASERARLEADAGDMPLGAYVRSRLLGDGNDQALPPPRRRVVRPSVDRVALGRLLSALGNARIANNLNQLAKAVNSGALPVCPETKRELQEACEHIKWMRQTLVSVLAVVPQGEDSP